MTIQDLLPGFKRYLLYEKNLTFRYVKAVFRSLLLLMNQCECQRVTEYSTDVLGDFLQRMCEERLWTNKTFRNYRQHLHTFFAYVVLKGQLKKNPVTAIAKPKLPARLPRCLTEHQLQTLISQVHCYPWQTSLQHFRNVAIIYTFLFTGIRLSELLNLKVTHVNFEEQTFFIERGKGKKDRYVPLHPKLIPVLKAYQRKRTEVLSPAEYFFTSARSPKRLTEKNLYAIVQKLVKACGFKFTPHQLRHTFARVSIENGLGLFLLKEILGHSSVSTSEIYLSVATSRLSSSFAKLDMF